MEFKSFGSLDEMIQHMDEGTKAANERVLPWQAEVKPGDLFLRIEDFGGGEQLFIFGEVLSPDYGKTPEELEYERSDFEKHRLRFYYFSRCYSVACEEGEFGDTHACTLATLITREMFENAKTQGWSSDTVLEWINQRQLPLWALDKTRMEAVVKATGKLEDQQLCNGCPLVRFGKGHPNYTGGCEASGIFCPLEK